MDSVTADILRILGVLALVLINAIFVAAGFRW